VACLSNERQISFRFGLAFSECQGLKDPGVWSWFTNDVGRPKLGWICPSAPFLPRLAAPHGFFFGTYRSAWSLSDDRGTFFPGSYGVNWWLFLSSTWDQVWADSLYPERFRSEGEILRPASTPFAGDAIVPYLNPRASDLPPTDLVPQWTYRTMFQHTGTGTMPGYCIPRHGSRPNPVPTFWPRGKSLPGAINVTFFDGHVELVKLDYLWQLYWHKDYKPPAKRPGLP
jgi:prepilin-type processing-associated H-X9-DG protein